MYLPTPVEQLAIQARLNFMLGPREYDRLFIDFVCGEIRGTCNGSKPLLIFQRSPDLSAWRTSAIKILNAPTLCSRRRLKAGRYIRLVG
jgi:hypothetical protein